MRELKAIDLSQCGHMAGGSRSVPVLVTALVAIIRAGADARIAVRAAFQVVGGAKVWSAAEAAHVHPILR